VSETRRAFLLGGTAALLLPWRASAAEQLHIGAARGSIDFAIGDSKIFRTTGSFKEWQGLVLVEDADVARSTGKRFFATFEEARV
jgi:polyisoprenoid-binding protein YceI